jgi:uncharacterized protein (TIGR03032 family)
VEVEGEGQDAEHAVSAPEDAAASPLRSVHTSNLPELFARLGISLVVSTYQAGKVILVRSDGDALNTHFRTFTKPMGVAADAHRLTVGGAHSICCYRNMPALAAKLSPPGKHDACFLPRRLHVTGDVDVHEMAYDDDGELWFVNTRFSCLCTLDEEHSFTPRWRPSFVGAYAPEDRCHLNGLAMVDGRPKYVTALGGTDTAGGWRESKASGGLLIDVERDGVVLRRLSMPHSPRSHAGWLWLLESGQGSLAEVDLARAQWRTVASLPGFTRGLDFVGPLAFIGLSQVRESAVFRAFRWSSVWRSAPAVSGSCTSRLARRSAFSASKRACKRSSRCRCCTACATRSCSSGATRACRTPTSSPTRRWRRSPSQSAPTQHDIHSTCRSRSSASVASACELAETTPEARTGRDTLAAAAQGQPGSVIGRGPEVAELRSGLDDVRSSRGRVLLLVGEPGIGKTRLAEEAAALAETRGFAVAWGRCHEWSAAASYWPWARILEAHAEARPRDHLRSDLGLAAPLVARIAPALREHLPDLPPPESLGPEEARSQLFAGFARYLRAAVRRAPLLLVVDDLHWADADSLRLLEFLTHEIAASPIAVLATCREEEARWSEPLARTLSTLGRAAAIRRLSLAPSDRTTSHG